jgi:hypothetical protein
LYTREALQPEKPRGWRKWGERTVFVYSGETPHRAGFCVGLPARRRNHCAECGGALESASPVYVVGFVSPYSQWPATERAMKPLQTDDRELVCLPCFETQEALWALKAI